MSKKRPALIPTAAVAERLRVTTRTVHRLVEAHQLVPEVKVPGLRGAYLFTEDEVARVERERQAQRAERVPA